MPRRVLVTLIVFSVVIGLGLLSCGQSPASGSPTSTPTPQLKEKGVADVVSAKAVGVPYKEAKLSFQAAGRVLKVLVSEGQVVTAGQELARLETRDLEQAVRRAEAGLKAAQAQLAKAKAGARPEEIALAEAAVAIAQGNLAAAQATLSSAQANLNKLLAGPTESDLQIAEKQVELAKNQLWGLQKQRDVTWGVLDGQVAVAGSQVEIAQLQLEKLKAGARAEDIAIARAQVAQAQAAIQVIGGYTPLDLGDDLVRLVKRQAAPLVDHLPQHAEAFLLVGLV